MFSILLAIILTFPLIIGVFLWVRREILDLTEAQFLFLEVICFSSFYFEIYFVMKNKFLFVVFFLVLPLIMWGIVILITRITEKKLTKNMEKKEINELLATIEKYPDNVNSHIRMGDIYFEKGNYNEAMKYYKRAYQINPLPWIKFRIEVTERENMIKEKKIWICPECGRKNAEDILECPHCGFTIKTKEAIVNDFKKIWEDKEFVKKSVIYLTLGPVAIIGICILFFFSIFYMVYFFKKFNIFVAILLSFVVIFVNYLIVVNLLNFFFKENEE